MRHVIRPAVAAVGAGLLAAALASASATVVLAQAAKQPSPTAAAPAEPEVKEVALTEKQVAGVLAAHKEIDALAAKMPDDPKAKPDPKILKQLDDTAKKYGFAGYADYGDVVETISLVLAGIDFKTKTYVGPEAELKQQIATVQADTKMSAQDKKQALEDLNEALKSPGPVAKNQANIDLVVKNYDKLSEALDEDE